MHEKGGTQEGLNPIELLSAYGFAIQKVTQDSLVLLVRGLPKSPVTVLPTSSLPITTAAALKPDQKFAPIARVESKTVVLQSIFLHVTEGGLLPKVTQADFKGFNFDDGKPVEIKLPAKKLTESRYD